MNTTDKKETYLRAFFDSFKEIGALIGREGEVLLYNSTASKFVKAHANNDVKAGDLFINYCSPDLHSFFSENISQALQGKEVLNREIEQKRDFGMIIWSMSFIPVKDDEGNIYAVAFIGEDITPYKVQQSKVVEQYESLRHIAFRISHTIRAPLANILGLANLIKANGYANPVNEGLLELLSTSAEQLDKTIRDIATDVGSSGTSDTILKGFYF